MGVVGDAAIIVLVICLAVPLLILLEKILEVIENEWNRRRN